ncbi:MAG TPA: DUF4105 domain-containing protein [Gemmatimonadales bacterium]
MPAGLLLLAALAAAPGAPVADSAADGGRLAVYLVTFSPGPRLWERFGHNGIWIRDTVTGDGPLYDFGRFDFQQEQFYRNFAMGRPRYWMGREDGVAVVNRYVGAGRSVWLQELAIIPAARLRLRESLDSAWADDGGAYRYHYYLDNCSTRIRDAIDGAVGGALKAALSKQPTLASWRFHTRRSLQDNVLQYVGVTASLGPAADQLLTWWDETFLPMKLFEYVRGVLVPGAAGVAVPLVKGEIQVARSDRWLVPDVPESWTSRFLLVGLALGGLLWFLGSASGRRRWARRSFLALGSVWLFLAGAFGAVFVFFWAFTEHAFAFRNQNLWQLNLLAFALLPLLPSVTRPGRRGRAAGFLAAALGVLAVVGVGVELVAGRFAPALWQDNGDILALTVPAQVGLALGAWFAVRNRAAS